MMKNLLMLCCGLLLSATAFADSGVHLILTKGSDKAIPIAVVPFAQSDSTTNMADIISADLSWTGAFKVQDPNTLPAKPHQLSEVNASAWRSTGVEDLVVGSVNADSLGQENVHFALVDLVKAEKPVALLAQSYHIAAGQERALAHHIADVVFEQLTGVKGIFSTRIAYVQKVGGNNYMLLVSDADGYNPRPILTSIEPIMSPAWSPDGKRIAYVSFEDKRAQIYVATIASGQRQKMSEAPGINGAPAWSPDGRSLALVLSKSGAPKIYLLDLASAQLKQLTTGRSIDTEPSFAPDGQSILFTSDRGGSPQIYRLALAGGKIDRITFSGEYNARASFSRDGKQIVMLHRTNGQYNIAVQNVATGVVTVLTHSGRDDSPTFAPNGMMILYGNEYGELGLVSADGRVKLRVPGKGGTVQDPAWSPFLN